MIKKLEWDSNFFGYPVGIMYLEEFQKFDFEDFKNHGKAYKLIYLYSKDELPIRANNFYLVDKKVVFIRNTEELLISDIKDIENYSGEVTDQLLNLTYQSGIYSRFNVDKNFINNEFRSLYQIWIEKSVNRILVDYVFIYKYLEKIMGFVTLGSKENDAEIGLIAVDTELRGQGIGSKLLKFAVYKAKQLGYPQIKVTTQLNNEPAVELYSKNGFKISDLTYIYHFWSI